MNWLGIDTRGLLGAIKFNNEVDPTLGAESAVILQQKAGKIIAVTDFVPLAK